MPSGSRRRVLIIGLDGMRPDMFDPQAMPALGRLVESGTRLPDHHAIYPTHTRVNISTLATGVSPGRHGVVANVFRLMDDATDLAIVDTSNDAHLRRLDASPAGPTILNPTLGDILDEYDERVAVAATSTAGAGIIWTRNQPYRVVNVNSHYDRADLLSLREKLGPVPPGGFDYRLERQMYAARAVTDIFLKDEDARVVVLWLNEPDSSLHGFGLGSPQAREALEICDAAIEHVIDALDRSGQRDQFDIFVISDHGHSTVLHHRSLGEYLDRARRDIDLGDLEIETASDFLYLTGSRSMRPLTRLVRWIQEQPWTGAVFGSGPYGDMPGALALEDLWGGQLPGRAPALAVSPVWTDATNDFGVPGTVAALTEQVALRSTHGAASPYDLHAFLTISGPDIAEGVTTNLPTGAIDLTPTVLQLLGHALPDPVDGRVVWEAFRDPQAEPGAHRRSVKTSCVLHPDGFSPEIIFEHVGDTTYVDRVTNGRSG